MQYIFFTILSVLANLIRFQIFFSSMYTNLKKPIYYFSTKNIMIFILEIWQWNNPLGLDCPAEIEWSILESHRNCLWLCTFDRNSKSLLNSTKKNEYTHPYNLVQSIHKQDHQRWRYDTVIHLEQSQKYPQDIPQISGLVWSCLVEGFGTAWNTQT